MLHLVSINCRYSHSCPAQFYVRNALVKHLPNQPLILSQFTINDPYYATLLRISGQLTKAVLFSVYIWNHSYVQRLVNDLTNLLPDLPIILGGPQASALVQTCTKACTTLPAQCVLVIGEIEGVNKKFYRDLHEGTLQPVYRAEKNGSFPSPYQQEDFSTHLRNRQIYYESSRGCPFSCSYCLSSVAKTVRHKPLVLVRHELRDLIAAEPMIIKLVDRTFNDKSDRAIAVWQFLLDHAGKIRFHFEIAPDRFTEPMFDLLAKVPCDFFQFEIGIQSCNDQVLAAVNRRMQVKKAEQNIRRLIALDTIHIHVDLILGLPFDTEASFQDSFNRVFRLAPHHIQLGLLKVLPGTEMEQRAEEFGLIYCAEPPYEVLATNWLKHDQLIDLYEFCECVESFYNNRFFRSLWRYLLRTGEKPYAFFRELLILCRKHNFFRLARTHKLMNRILVKMAAQRRDSDLLLELLRFDWLRCGYRELPENIAQTVQPELRNRLRRELPQSMDGVFSSNSRLELLKKSTFLELSAEAVAALELGDSGPAVLAFLPSLTGGVMKFNRISVLKIE